MKGKIFELKGNDEYYVLEEIDYNEKKYVIVAPCNSAKDELDENNMVVMEIVLNNGILSVTDIYDDDLAIIVSNLLLNKMKTNSVISG